MVVIFYPLHCFVGCLLSNEILQYVCECYFLQLLYTFLFCLQLLFANEKCYVLIPQMDTSTYQGSDATSSRRPHPVRRWWTEKEEMALLEKMKAMVAQG